MRILLKASVALVTIGILWCGTELWAQKRANEIADIEAGQVAHSHAGLLASELQKYRLLPLVLAEHPEVVEVLAGRSKADGLNPQLETLAARTNAAVIYAVGVDGTTVAASNWQLTTSFVGQNYAHRPYVQGALRDGSAELFAQGMVSLRPGLFIAQRVVQNGKTLGVIVVKVEFDELERAWSRRSGMTFVSDAEGIVNITSLPNWRFQKAKAIIRTTVARQSNAGHLGDVEDKPANFDALESVTVFLDRVGGVQSQFRVASYPAALKNGSLYYLHPLEEAFASAQAAARAFALAGLLAIFGITGFWLRARERNMLHTEARENLEREVALRTMQLTETNARLQRESHEREQSDAKLRSAREELSQASRLSYIGQITAGVAHEINQPLAAIRTLAENAIKFIELAKVERVEKNLVTIVHLTGRISTITAELRNFSRRAVREHHPVNLELAMDGALLLVRDNIRSSKISLQREAGELRVSVIADRVRLEQVLVNLFQNAVDALQNIEKPIITISVHEDGGDWIAIRVCDNGNGVPADIVDSVFVPFVTSRPEGLGLGLGISRDIAREFNGELLLSENSSSGASFELRLKKA